jgi:hypothetical protein
MFTIAARREASKGACERWSHLFENNGIGGHFVGLRGREKSKIRGQVTQAVDKIGVKPGLKALCRTAGFLSIQNQDSARAEFLWE